MATDDGLDLEASEQLRRVREVTDAALAHLTLERLLDELLTRVAELLSVDTATVMLLDDAGKYLVATAAKGLEEEVHRRVRVPVGKGFAGMVASTASPVIIENVDPTKVMNPILIEKGLRTLLGVPLIVDGSVIGVLHVGALTERSFDSNDVRLLRLVADRVALAIEARAREGQSVMAETLQRALLPEALPELDGFDLAARYVPSEGGMIGGDWYDVFTTPLGTVCFAVGDVVGRGVGAAIVMARLRNGVRAHALEEHPPHEVVTRLNRLLGHFDPGEMATMVYGTIDPRGLVQFANAGHMPPLLVRPDADPQYLEGTVDPLLGGSDEASYITRSAVLEQGATLLLFTDGLVERRGTPLDEGFELVGAAATQVAGRSLPQMCDELVAFGRSFSGLDDDLALLAIRYQGPQHQDRIERSTDAEPAELRVISGGLQQPFADVTSSGATSEGLLEE